VAGEGTTTRVAVALEAEAVAATAVPGTAAVVVAAPESPHRRIAFGLGITAGYISTRDAQVPGGSCSASAQGGLMFNPAAFVDIRATSWLRVRTGIRGDIATWGYSEGNPMACGSAAVPKNVTAFLLAPFVQAAPRLFGGPDWDVHALLGAALEIPLGNGQYEVTGGSAPTEGVPGLGFASPISSSGEVGIGVISHGLTVDALVRIQRLEPNPNSMNVLDFGLLSQFLLSVSYTRW
jgi:hypothetical protein